MKRQLVYNSGLGPSPRTEETSSRDDQVICLQNIGPAEQRKRLRFGLVALAAGLLIGSLLVFTGVSQWWRLLLFLLFAGGAIGFFQSREKT